jgi:hypothetical protein
MSKQELSEEAQRLLKLIPPDGSFAGNTSLRRKSGLEEKYWSVRNELERGGFRDEAEASLFSSRRLLRFLAMSRLLSRMSSKRNLNCRDETGMIERGFKPLRVRMWEGSPDGFIRLAPIL